MTLHAHARAALAEFTHADAQQRERAREYREFLDRHPDGVWRTCQPGHITASALVVDAGARHVLLTLHPKVGRWLQLGGHLEHGDASLRDGAIREVVEECGIGTGSISADPVRLDRHPVPCGRLPDGGPRASEHLDVQYVVVVSEAFEPVISEESDDLRWFDRAQLPEIDVSVRALIEDAAAVAAPAHDDPRWVPFSSLTSG